MASSAPPIGRRGRGPLCYGARVEMATVAGKPPGVGFDGFGAASNGDRRPDY
jgi:hypothetical protein